MKKFLILVLAMGFILISIPGFADDFDFQGNFTQDNNVVRFNFTVGQASNVTVFSSSWLHPPTAGVAPGGFDPMLGIWTASGALMAFQDDGGNAGTTLSNGVAYNHGVWDSYYEVNLAAGNYIATVTEYANFNVNNNLSSGFWYDNNPHFTNTLGYGPQPDFNGVWNSNDGRTDYWQFHLLNVQEASQGGGEVPEPGTLLLIGSGLIGLVAFRKRLKK